MKNQNNYLILGLGNPLLCDDTVGFHILEKLKNDQDLSNNTFFDFKENHSGGLDLLDDICNYKKVFIIDNFESDEYESGTCLDFDINDLTNLEYTNFVNTHGLNLPTIFKLGSKLGYNMPEQCKIIGITGNDCKRFSEKMSKNLMSKSDDIYDYIKKKILSWSD